MSAMETRELQFLLDEVVGLPGLLEHERFDHLSDSMVDDVFETAGKIARHHFAPCNPRLDTEEPDVVEGRVVLPAELDRACRAFIDSGLMRAHLPEDLGGMQLPQCVFNAAMSYFQAANLSAIAYMTLTVGAANLLHRFGTAEQKERYMQPMYDGRFFGTMALSEPQAGSSLADIRTRATPNDDGSYSIVGTKQWISAGEHELADNIVHLLLARTDDAPAGVRGISLFVVPRYRLDEAGEPAVDNDVRLVSLLHKMGYRGIPSTILALGTDHECRGWLVGEEGQGLSLMFSLMNEARIGVGMGAAAVAYAGFRYSLDYASTRKQGRRRGGRDPSRPMVAISEHADVRHMLLAQKTYAEGGLALGLYCAGLLDAQLVAAEQAEREDIGLLVELLTPVVKAWLSDYGLEANRLAIQVLGGYGYTRDYPVEQYYRDNRLNPIHEGTNGIQALDLLGRKVSMSGGRGLEVLEARMRATLDAAAAHTVLDESRAALTAGIERLKSTTSALLTVGAQQGEEHMLANASTYLHLFGHTTVAWLWLEQGLRAAAALERGAGARAGYYRGKIDACRYFHRWELPKTEAMAAMLASDDGLVLETDPATL